MPIREYKCNECNLVAEEIILGIEEPQAIECKRCGAEAAKLDMPTSVALMRSSMDNSPIDNAIGKDAEKRWEAIHERQETRDKIRKETGSVGLTRISKDEYKPISEENTKLRTDLHQNLIDPPKLESGKETSKEWLDEAK